jgi:hypothetical protein
MWVVWLIVFSVLLYVGQVYLAGRYLVVAEKPPKAVRAAGMAEGIFGVLIWAGTVFIENSGLFRLMVLIVGVFWICLAVSLYRASKTGRLICGVLSIVRILTVIGIPFSLFSFYMLFFNKESQAFFNHGAWQ